LNEPLETVADAKSEYDRWDIEIRMAEKDREKWEGQAKKVIKRYRDERPSSEKGGRKFNLLWSNVETLKPALYAATPNPEITRKFKDSDPVGRAASEILERATGYAVENYDFDTVMRSCVTDYLLTARGAAWVRYNAEFEDITPEPEYLEPDVADVMAGGTGFPEGAQYGEDGRAFTQEEPYQQVTSEEAVCDYIHWMDFLHNPARYWGEVRWVAKRAFMTRDELVKRFGDKGKKVPLDHKPKSALDDEGKQNEAFKKATVWEIWDKTTKTVYWIARDHKELLDRKKDPLNLRGFFPCPRPLYATLTTDSLNPIPDYVLYQDQVLEIDEMTARINLLLESLKIAGVYDSSVAANLGQIIKGRENVLVPVDQWATFAEKGGLKGVIDYLPIDQIATVLAGLYDARDKAKDALFEITGISDIIRGTSQASETATAQRLKGQFASLRIRDRQTEVQRFARDIIRMKAELIAEKFDPERIAEMSGVKLMDEEDMQLFPQVIDLLRNEVKRSFRIDIETDSTIQPDEQAEKEARIQFIEAMSSFIERAFPLMQAAPEMAPLVGEMMMFTVRGFKTGRTMEAAFDRAMEGLQERLSQPQDDPRLMEAQQVVEQLKAELDAVHGDKSAEMQKAEADMALKAQGQQADMALREQEMVGNMELKAAEIEGNQRIKEQMNAGQNA